MDKSSFILIVTFAAFLVLNEVAQIEGVSVLCRRLSIRGKRMNKCRSARHKVKRAMAIRKTRDVEIMDERIHTMLNEETLHCKNCMCYINICLFPPDCLIPMEPK